MSAVRDVFPYYPLCLDVRRKRCIVIGGGTVAERKVRTLLSCGADVRVVSPRLTRGLSLLVRRRKIEHRSGVYRGRGLAGAALVISATDDAGLNAAAAGDAKRRGIPVNVVDALERSTFIAPAVFKRGRITVSVSTNGTSPFLARKVKELLMRTLGKEYAAYSRLYAGARLAARRSFPGAGRRLSMYRRIAASPVLELLKNGRHRQAKAIVRNIIKEGTGGG